MQWRPGVAGLDDDRGSSGVEQTIVVVLVALAALGAYELLGGNIGEKVDCVAGAIGTGAAGPCDARAASASSVRSPSIAGSSGALTRFERPSSGATSGGTAAALIGVAAHAARTARAPFHEERSSHDRSIGTGLMRGVVDGVAAQVAASIRNLAAALQSAAEGVPEEIVDPATLGFAVDIDLGWISREPEIDYVPRSTDPTREGWPVEGEVVTWQAHVKNWGDTAVTVPYVWTLDGVEVGSGTVDIAANGDATIDLPQTWSFERHDLELVLDPNGAITETSEGNNAVTIQTDAIAVAFYVEQSVYDYFHAHQNELGVGSNSWADWAERQVSLWNAMLANAIYPDTPDGVHDRVRIDNIVVVPDGALPLAGGVPTNHPNLDDHTVDLQWGFPATGVGMYTNTTSPAMDNPFFYEGSLFHELGHARYLVDLYSFNVHDDGTGKTVAIEENGVPIVGSLYMPMVRPDAVYITPIEGLMNGEYTKVDYYSAAALNLIAGRRALDGNANAPGNLGAFLSDLPAENRFTIRDQNGVVMTDASFEVYRTVAGADLYSKYFDDVPDMSLRTDASGQVLLGPCPFDADGNLSPWEANGVIIVRVEQGGRVGYAFVESTQLNMEYWRGHTDFADYDLVVNMIDP